MNMPRIGVGLCAVLLVVAQGAAAGDWKEWKNDEYGIKMQVPEKMVLAGKKYQKGWGGLYGRLGPVELFVIGKLNAFPKLEQMQAFGVLVSGIPARKWKLIDEDEGKRGWKWHKTYRADRLKVIFAVLAQNDKGSFVIFLRTTRSNLRRHLGAYKKWYESVVAY